MGVDFLELNVVELVVVLEHFAHVGLNQLARVHIEALVIEFLNYIVHCLQLFPSLLAVLALQLDVLDEPA